MPIRQVFGGMLLVTVAACAQVPATQESDTQEAYTAAMCQAIAAWDSISQAEQHVDRDMPAEDRVLRVLAVQREAARDLTNRLNAVPAWQPGLSLRDKLREFSDAFLEAYVTPEDIAAASETDAATELQRRADEKNQAAHAELRSLTNSHGFTCGAKSVKNPQERAAA